MHLKFRISIAAAKPKSSFTNIEVFSYCFRLFKQGVRFNSSKKGDPKRLHRSNMIVIKWVSDKEIFLISKLKTTEYLCALPDLQNLRTRLSIDTIYRCTNAKCLNSVQNGTCPGVLPFAITEHIFRSCKRGNFIPSRRFFAKVHPLCNMKVTVSLCSYIKCFTKEILRTFWNNSHILY